MHPQICRDRWRQRRATPRVRELRRPQRVPSELTALRCAYRRARASLGGATPPASAAGRTPAHGRFMRVALRLSASGRDGSPPGGRPSRHSRRRRKATDSHSLDSRRRRTHNHSPDSRRRKTHSHSLDSGRRKTHSHSPGSRRRKTHSHSRRPRNTTRRRRRLLRKLRGDMPFGGRPQRSRVLAVVLFGHQHCQGIAPQSFATIEARRARQSVARLQR